MALNYVPHGTTRKLTAADEAASATTSTKNLEQQAFLEWPNEAGVSRLSCLPLDRNSADGALVVQFEGLTEHRGPIELTLKGNIPAWAAGSLYRTGPGQGKVEDTKSGTFHVSHWFDGLAHTHRFDIVAEDVANNSNDAPTEPVVRVYYSSRRQSDDVVADIKAAGTWRSMSFAQKRDPCVGLFGKAMSVFNKRPSIHNVSVTVCTDLPAFKPPAGAAVAAQGHRTASVVIATDSAAMCEIDPQTMEPISYPKQTKYHPDLRGPLSAAHGKFDPETGDYVNFNLDLGKQPVYRIFSISAATGKTTILATIPATAAYLHSIFLTRHHVVLLIPVSHYQWKGAKIPLEGNLLHSLKPFDASEPCRWFVVDRHHGKGVVAKFASPAGFFFHSVNAFEDDDSGDILCEMIHYPNRHIIDGFYYDVLLNRNNAAADFWTTSQTTQQSFPLLSRYRLAKSDFTTTKGPLPTPQEIFQIPPPHIGDLPTINPSYRLRRHRFVYVLINRALSTLFDSIAKIDVDTREVLRWEGPKGHTPGEAIFVPRPRTGKVEGGDGKGEGDVGEEDDGVLLSVVLDGENKTSYLLCLDARTMEEVGRAECGFAVAFGLHGRHVGKR